MQHFEASTHIYIFVKFWVLAGRANEMLLNKHVFHKTYFFYRLKNWGGSGTAPERCPLKKSPMYGMNEFKCIVHMRTNEYKCTVQIITNVQYYECTVQMRTNVQYSTNGNKCTVQILTNVQYKWVRMCSTNKNKCAVQMRTNEQMNKWVQMWSTNKNKCAVQMRTNVQYKCTVNSVQRNQVRGRIRVANCHGARKIRNNVLLT